MAIFKCKMCGGTLEISEKITVIECEYCGTHQTLPKLDDDRRLNLYDRANHFRRNNEFDKAMGIYEKILIDDNTDAEAYWSLVLCNYGIEYVEDPSSHKRMPTVNRAQFTSIFDDVNYKFAIKYADSYQRQIYEHEAKKINEIQKEFLVISQKEEPFDVFICYKETDNDGRRTPDSVLANELYHQLIQEGFKVFFSRITLEDKLGVAYEPYIFAALNTAKVMVVLGTKPEYFDAAWVKNEWNRYLALIKQGRKNMLIPAYRDMDPYDLPEEFSHLQAQDMSKLGFMQDLTRGIKKIINTEEPKINEKKETFFLGGNNNIAPLLKRAFMFLEDGEWHSANEYCEKVLDLNPECAEAYLGKLMVELQVRHQDELKEQTEPFNNSNYYQKAVRFADESLKNTLTGYIENINERIESARKDAVLKNAKMKMNSNLIADYEAAIGLFESVPGWKDADERLEICRKKIKYLGEKAEAERIERERELEIAIEEEKKRKKKNLKIAAIVTPIICVVLAFIIIWSTAIVPNRKYNEALELMDVGEYESAYVLLGEIRKTEEINSSKYERANEFLDAKDYESSLELFEQIENYKDSKEKILDIKYNVAISDINSKNYIKAYEALIEIAGHKDSREKADNIYAAYKNQKLETAKVGDYVFFGSYEQDNYTSNGKEDIEWLVYEVTEDGCIFVISKYALDYKQYNSTFSSITWARSTVRDWLNVDFYNEAFSDEEKNSLMTSWISSNPDSDVITIGDNSTTFDKVFLMSVSDAQSWFSDNSDRRCEPTAYVKAKNRHCTDDEGYCSWLLLTPGKSNSYVSYVESDGFVNVGGANVNGMRCIRPAVIIDRSKLI